MFRFVKPLLSRKHIHPSPLYFSNTIFNKPIPITRLNDQSIKPEPIKVKQTVNIPFPNSHVSIEYEKELKYSFSKHSIGSQYAFNVKDIIYHAMNPVAMIVIVPTLMIFGPWVFSNTQDIVLGYTCAVGVFNCVDVYMSETKTKTKTKSEPKTKPRPKPSPPLVIIDDFETKAPYAKIFTMLSNYNNLCFITPKLLDKSMTIPNNEKVFHIQLFFNKYKEREIKHNFLDIEYIEYLTRDQMTHLIDWKLKNKYGSVGKMSIGSITHDIAQYYNPAIGTNNVFKPIEHFFGIKDWDKYNGHLTNTNTNTLVPKTYHHEQIIVSSSSIDFSTNTVVLIDPLDYDINYLDSTLELFKKMTMFQRKCIIFHEGNQIPCTNTNKLFNFPKQRIVQKLDCEHDTLYYVDNSSYYSRCVDDSIQDMNRGGSNVYILAIDDNFKKLYRGKYPLVDFGIEFKNRDLDDMDIWIPTTDKERSMFELGFADSQREFSSGYCTDDINWMNGYLYGKKCDMR